MKEQLLNYKPLGFEQGHHRIRFTLFTHFFFHGYIQGVLKKGYTDSFVIKFSRLRPFLKSIYNSGFNKPNFRRRPNNNNFKVSSSFQLE